MACTTAALLALSVVGSLAADWPQWLGPKRDGIWREERIIEKFPPAGPAVMWRAPIAGGYSGPAVVDGSVYLTDRQLKSGAANPSNPFDRGIIPGNERVLRLEAATGRVIWTHEYDCPYTVSYAAGPRATPAVDGEFVYTLGAEGHLLCLQTKDGKVTWSRDLKLDYQIPTPVWGFSGHPLIDGDKLICLVGGEGSVAVAFDKKTGREIWRALSAKEPGYCPPMIYEAAGRRQLIIWHPESINSLDPANGKLLWSHPFKVQSALTAPTPRVAGDRLFITSFYNGSKLLQLTPEPGAKLLWQGLKASERDTLDLHSIMSTPVIVGDHVYGVCSYGQLRCLKLATGERVWETMAATTPDGKEARWANAFLTPHQDRFFLWNEKGDLIIARLTPKGYEEISRAHLLEPTQMAAGRSILWSHPAFADGSLFARNDKELIRVNLRAQ